jgi:hypothetical protein
MFSNPAPRQAFTVKKTAALHDVYLSDVSSSFSELLDDDTDPTERVMTDGSRASVSEDMVTKGCAF